MNRIIATAFAALALVLSVGAPTSFGQGSEFPKEWFWHSDDGQRAKHAELLGKPAPALELTDWKNGELKPADMKGKVLVIDFWATWCGPCIASIPHNNEMAEKYKAKGVEVIGVCTNARGQENYEKVVADKGIKYPSARDPKLVAEKAWRVMWYPTYAVVDRKGNVRAIGLKPDAVEKVVEKLVSESANARAEDEPSRVILASMAGGADKGAEWRERELSDLEGKAPPALAVENWMNGEAMKLADLKGKVVLVDFWATWCGPCIASIPHTNELLAKNKDKGLVVIGVCATTGAEKMAETVKEKGIRYPVAADSGEKTVKAFNVDSFPDYYLIDRSGKLRIADCKNGSVDEAVEALLAEKQTTSAE